MLIFSILGRVSRYQQRNHLHLHLHLHRCCHYLRQYSLENFSRYPSLLAQIADTSRNQRIAIIDPSSGKSFTYGELHQASSNLARYIRLSLSFKPSTIACHHTPGVSYVISSLATWKLGATLVPLSPSHTQKELEYFVTDSGAELILLDTKFGDILSNITVKKISVPDEKINIDEDLTLDNNEEFPLSSGRTNDNLNALIVYTSGTTGQPKGVVHTQASIMSMILSLNSAWEYTNTDKILHFLPLHHLHGILNKLWCVLYAGGVVEFLKSANAIDIWTRLADSSQLVTLFMAVPTVYAKMLETHSRKDLPQEVFDAAIRNMSTIRVMISGSASLPVPILHKWKVLSGHFLLERYGMTEVGMALSNPLHGERKAGFVGNSLPFVECKIVTDKEFLGNNSISESEVKVTTEKEETTEAEAEEECGELLLKGPTLFKEYHNRLVETQSAFDSDGWFRTGDIALRKVVNGKHLYRILGRNSTDIIKSGGYKLSALEIERELLSHPQLSEAAVIGIQNEIFGEVVAAVLVVAGGDCDKSSLSMDAIREFLKSRLAPYKIPRIIRFVDFIPKNQLGKVNKKTLWRDLQLDQETITN